MKKLLLILVLAGSVVFSAVNPENLSDKVRNRIAEHYGMDEEFVITANQEGKVTIEGTVGTLWDFYRMFELASKVNGVRSISNQLMIDTPMLPDELVKSNIINEMHYIRSILEPDRIKISVDNGIVFLDGKVSFYREKKMLQTMISWQEGVKGIVNDLEVLPAKKAVSDKNLKRIIQNLLEKEFPLENVNLTINDGVVTLEGETKTLWALHEIEEQVSDLLGVQNVKNNLSVTES
ncbi:BON domain-containing protein [candidate division KSB1 bacterium]|nr:BON domain-containing protein [candidate division KSB1 bacterium]